MRTAVVLTAALALLAGATLAEEPGIRGSLGWDVHVRPIPPATLDITSDITLSLSLGPAYVLSTTRLSWLALEGAYLELGYGFETFALSTGMRFDPCFSMYRLSVRSVCCPFSVGGLLQLENTAPLCDPPVYSMGFVLDMELWIGGCFWARSLTGFGAWDLYALIDDRHDTDIALAPGLWLEEQLLGLGYRGACFSADVVMLFTPLDLWPTWTRYGAAYRWPDPLIEVGARLWTLGLFTFDAADLILRVDVSPVSLESITTFDLGGFVLQELYLGVAFSGIEVYTRSTFDAVGLIVLTVGVVLHF